MISSGKFVVVTPVYEDVEASNRLFAEFGAQFGERLFVVAVDDGSVKQPLTTAGLDAAGLAGVVVRLRRNVGHQRAIAIGLGYVTEHLSDDRITVVMDSDGEDMPATVPALIEQLGAPAVDVAVAHRRARVETMRFKLFYAIYKRFFRLITGRRISFGNFMALKPFAVKRLSVMPETSIHVASATLASRLRIAICPLDRGPRYAGRSKMNFVGLVLHGFKGLMVFAEDVLVRVGLMAAAIGAFSIGASVLAVLLKGLGYSTPGWFSVAMGILVIMFLQTAALSLMTLMLTGVVRSGAVATPQSYQEFVEEILHSRVAAAEADGGMA